MEKMSSWVPRAVALTGLMMLVGSGCIKDLDSLSANYGNGGASGGHGGKSGTGGNPHGGSPATGGSPSEGGEAGVSGEGGEAGDIESGGKGGTGTGGRAGAGSGGRGFGGGTCEDQGLATCPGIKGCVDLGVGTPMDNGVTNCGACGTTCALDNATAATCAAAVCSLTCSAGTGDCNATTANDGCESDLTTIAHCGSCTNACSTQGASSTQCVGGGCLPTCAPAYGDCNAGTPPAPNDGCETYFDALEHCTTGCTDAFVACSATTVCNSGSCVAPSGITVLSTPLTMTGDQTRFSDVFPGYPFDLTGASVKARVYAPGATGGTIKFFVSDNMSAFGSEVILDLTTLNQKWTDVTVPVSGVNPKIVKQLNLLIIAGDSGYANPTTVYVDSVRATNQLVNETFDTTQSGFVKSGLIAVPGASVSWTAAMP